MIGNGRRQATSVAVQLFTLSALTGALALPARASLHAPQASSAPAAVASQKSLSVTLVRDGIESTYVTHAATVRSFLAELGIVTTVADNLSPSADTALSDGARIEFRAAVPVQLFVGRSRRALFTAAPNVGALLAQQQITLGNHDVVEPQASERLQAGSIVRVMHETVWTAVRREFLHAKTIKKLDPELPPGTIKTVAAGRAGERDVTVRFVQRDGEPLSATRLASRVVRPPHSRIVAYGVGEYAAFAHFAERGFDATVGLARSALRMIATAYTAGCAGCSGYAANGMRAGHGIVAVDPHIIPIGTRLYIPGYGRAIAGDTGGAIIGNRIDLGFNSLGDAVQFGRRPVTVYLLR